MSTPTIAGSTSSCDNLFASCHTNLNYPWVYAHGVVAAPRADLICLAQRLGQHAAFGAGRWTHVQQVGQRRRDVDHFRILAVGARLDPAFAHDHQRHVGVVGVRRAVRGAAGAGAEVPVGLGDHHQVARRFAVPGAAHQRGDAGGVGGAAFKLGAGVGFDDAVLRQQVAGGGGFHFFAFQAALVDLRVVQVDVGQRLGAQQLGAAEFFRQVLVQRVHQLVAVDAMGVDVLGLHELGSVREAMVGGQHHQYVVHADPLVEV